MLEIHVMVLKRHKNVAELNLLRDPNPLPLITGSPKKR